MKSAELVNPVADISTSCDKFSIELENPGSLENNMEEMEHIFRAIKFLFEVEDEALEKPLSENTTKPEVDLTPSKATKPIKGPKSTTTDETRKPDCKYFRKGFCKLGNKCDFPHDIRNAPRGAIGALIEERGGHHLQITNHWRPKPKLAEKSADKLVEKSLVAISNDWI